MKQDPIFIKEQVFQEFAKKWSIPFENVKYIYWLSEDVGGKYGKTSRVLQKFQIVISPRQVRYFIKKVKLMVRLGGHKPANYSELMREET